MLAPGTSKFVDNKTLVLFCRRIFSTQEGICISGVPYGDEFSRLLQQTVNFLSVVVNKGAASFTNER
jgi:hypothetical protein